MHTQCANRWLSTALGPYDWLPERGIYAWAANDQLLAKICKPRKPSTPRDTAGAIEHARAAFARGSMFAPSIYVRWGPIPCAADPAQPCCAAIILRRLPDASRLDRTLASADANRAADLIELLFDSQRYVISQLPSTTATTESSLNTGDARIMNVIPPELEVAGRNLLQLWHDLRFAREPLMDDIRQRDKSGMCRQTHGDLAADNIYIHDGQVYPLDPCVTFSDLYELDTACDWAHLAVTLGSIQSVYSPAELIERCAKEAGTSLDLMQHYVARIALMRVTMRELSRDLSRRGNLGQRDLPAV